MDKAEAAYDARKAKKAAWRAKQGLETSGDGDGDDVSDDEGTSKKKKKKQSKEAKLNRDYQQVNAFMSKGSSDKH